MNDFHSLEQKLAANLDWHGARIKFLARFLTAIITTRTVNLTAIASVFAGRAQPAAHDERCHRFLKDVALPYAQIDHFIVHLLGVEAVGRWRWIARTGSSAKPT